MDLEREGVGGRAGLLPEGCLYGLLEPLLLIVTVGDVTVSLGRVLRRHLLSATGAHRQGLLWDKIGQLEGFK